MRTITSPRLTLRPWEARDADFLFDLESRWETVRYLGPRPQRMEDRSEAVASIERRRDLDDPVCGIWAITRTASGRLLGNPDNLASQKVCERLGMTPAGPTDDFYDAHYLLFTKNLTKP